MTEPPTADCERCGNQFPLPADGWNLSGGRCPDCRKEVPAKYLNRAARERRKAEQSRR